MVGLKQMNPISITKEISQTYIRIQTSKGRWHTSSLLKLKRKFQVAPNKIQLLDYLKYNANQIKNEIHNQSICHAQDTLKVVNKYHK